MKALMLIVCNFYVGVVGIYYGDQSPTNQSESKPNLHLKYWLLTITDWGNKQLVIVKLVQSIQQNQNSNTLLGALYLSSLYCDKKAIVEDCPKEGLILHTKNSDHELFFLLNKSRAVTPQ